MKKFLVGCCVMISLSCTGCGWIGTDEGFLTTNQEVALRSIVVQRASAILALAQGMAKDKADTLIVEQVKEGNITQEQAEEIKAVLAGDNASVVK